MPTKPTERNPIGTLAIQQVQGRKFTPVGSFATLLWLHMLGTKGHTITWGMHAGRPDHPPHVLLVTLVGLALQLSVLGVP